MEAQTKVQTTALRNIGQELVAARTELAVAWLQLLVKSGEDQEKIATEILMDS